MTTLAVAATLGLALLVGVSLGLLGGGGAILTVPILTAVAGVETRAAIASSLLVVGVTSAVSLVRHARAGRVRWRIGAIFGAAGAVGALAGGALGAQLPATLLMLVLAATMVAAAVAMLRRRAPAETDGAATPRLPLVLLVGAAVGMLAGLVGAGGGFLIVPALVLLVGLPTGVAVGTSLMVIAMQTLVGLAAQPGLADVPWALVLPFAAIAIVGALLGSTLTGRIPDRMLRRAFAGLVLVVAAAIIVQQLLPLLPLP
ncbi:MAG: sulfite exporter TauE/SafE family protein [Actinomycetota bacterium]